MAVALAAWHLRRRETRLAVMSAAAVGLGAALAAGPVFLLAWIASPGNPGLLEWLTRYGGGRQGSRIELAYGLVRSWRGV